MATYIVSSGVTSTGVTLDDYDNMYVQNGGRANQTTANDDGKFTACSSESSSAASSSGQSSVRHLSGYVGNVTVASGQIAYLNPGTIANDILIEDGGLMIVPEDYGDEPQVIGTITVIGQLNSAEGKISDDYNFSVVWDISGGNTLISPMIVNMGHVASRDFSVCISSNQKAGTYLLANGLVNLPSEAYFSIGTKGGTSGLISPSHPYSNANATYTMQLEGGVLTLTVTTGKTVAGNFTDTAGGAFQLMSDGTAYVRTSDAKTKLSGSIDVDQWEIVDAGDFNGSGQDGLLWLEKSTGYVYMQYDMTTLSEVSGKKNCLGIVDLEKGYSIKAAGDFTGNGISGALLQGPSFGDASISLNYGLPVWARNDDGSTFNGWLGALVNTWQEGDRLKGDLSSLTSINANNYQYKIVGVGDFNGDGRDDVMLQNSMPEVVTQDGVDYTITGSGDVFTFLTGDKAAIIAGAAPTVCYAGCATDGWEVLGFGDFDADGVDDALLSDGTGLAGWKMANGQRQSDFWFGALADDQEFAGIADFNGDGTDDVLIRSASTETMTAWLVKNGSVTGTLALK